MEQERNLCKNSKVWRKNLYSNFGYKDNYTDVTFLKNLRTNVNQQRITLSEAVVGAGRVTEQVCLVFIFIVIYHVLVENIHSPDSLLIISSIVTCVCYLYYLKVNLEKGYTRLLSSHTKTVVIFFILGYILSPVLKTLTETISTDTINATTFVMMLIHLIFFDYNAPAAIVSRALSLNAAIFGSLCLASRVPSSFHAFVLLTVSAECFVLYPPFAYSVRQKLSILYLLGLVSSTVIMLSVVSRQMCILFVLLVLFLNGFCPSLYTYLQRYKNNIYGPWDEAIIATKPFPNRQL